MSFASTSDSNLKVAFLSCLRELLTRREDVDYSQLDLIFRRITSNLTKVSNFPNQGKDSDAANWLLESANVPYPDEELVAL